MEDRPHIVLWDLMREVQSDPELCLTILARAIAHGCNEGDFRPGNLLIMIREDFDRLHIEKHVGRPN